MIPNIEVLLEIHVMFPEDFPPSQNCVAHPCELVLGLLEVSPQLRILFDMFLVPFPQLVNIEVLPLQIGDDQPLSSICVLELGLESVIFHFQLLVLVAQVSDFISVLAEV